MMQLASVAENLGGSVVGLRRGARRGSGVVVAQDRVAVLFHSLREDRVEVVFADGRSEDAGLAGVDRRHGVAVLQVPTDGAATVRWSQAQPSIGDSVFALANPGAGGLRATEGRVSAAPVTVRGRYGRSLEGMIEHTAPLPRGAGGGPLVDTGGAVLGVNALRADPGFLLALPAAGVSDAVEGLLAGRARPRYLGVALAPAGASRRMRAAVGLPHHDGLLVRRVEGGGPAELAGVQVGDLLVGLGDTDVQELADVYGAIDSAEGPLVVRILRGSERLTLTVDVSGARS
jgi:serine protease Do